MTDTPRLKTSAEVFQTEAVKILNYMIDAKVGELITYGNMVKRTVTDLETTKFPPAVNIRTYEEGRKGHHPEKIAAIPVDQHTAKNLIESCQMIVRLESEINELQRIKLRAARDYDFDDGGNLQNILWGQEGTSYAPAVDASIEILDDLRKDGKLITSDDLRLSGYLDKK